MIENVHVGSAWLRWDPHIHTPTTYLNPQFGPDPWEAYLKLIEEATPPVRALGITEYFTLEGYKDFRRHIGDARLRGVFIFPNVELRLMVETYKKACVNFHLLVSPEDPCHVERIEELLSRLRFSYKETEYPCTYDGLRRLGRDHHGDPLIPDRSALVNGVNQFKVNLSELNDLRKKDRWFQENVLLAVAAGDDGLAGLAKHASTHALRTELGRMAHIIFSGTESNRNYWLGEHPDFKLEGHHPKPCLHGCDAHSLDAVLPPSMERKTWIRGAATFDSLRQALAEPRRRVHIGPEPPSGALSSHTIRSIHFSGVAWLEPAALPLNDGLVAIIGSKGSGKTALAELIAFAAEGADPSPGSASFLKKAEPYLGGLNVRIEWADGSHQEGEPPELSPDSVPRVRYLSQQFVEKLCALHEAHEESSVPGVSLIGEIEKVVFDGLHEHERAECTTFSDLREVKMRLIRREREDARALVAVQSDVVRETISLEEDLPRLGKELADATRHREKLEETLESLRKEVGNEGTRAYEVACENLRLLQEEIAREERRAMNMRELLSEVERQYQSANADFQSLKGRFGPLLTADLWNRLEPESPSQVTEHLKARLLISQKRMAKLRENGIEIPTQGKGNSLLLAADSCPNRGLAMLLEEQRTAERGLAHDAARQKRIASLIKDIPKAKSAEGTAKVALTAAQGAPERRQLALQRRLEGYRAIFESIRKEEQVLRELYASLSERLSKDSRLFKLAIDVDRIVDFDAWIEGASGLLDMRKLPESKLRESAADLRRAWRQGDPDAIREEMRKLCEVMAKEAAPALRQNRQPKDLAAWMFSTNHISVRFGLQYEGTNLENLSPGTRGIVLLTLYLGLDDQDHRPIIVDQPEENLDPSSVFNDLVPFFRDAAKRRQVIIVTHNANLVVNTDADQVIVAEATRRTPKDMPVIRYSAGGLEDRWVRDKVCQILEGGADAFRKRGLRYGV